MSFLALELGFVPIFKTGEHLQNGNNRMQNVPWYVFITHWEVCELSSKHLLLFFFKKKKSFHFHNDDGNNIILHLFFRWFVVDLLNNLQAIVSQPISQSVSYSAGDSISELVSQLVNQSIN